MNANPGPEDRLESPVGAGGLRLLRTKTSRTAAYSAAGAVVVGIVVMIVQSSLSFKGPKSKPEDIGATKIVQTVPDPPVPEPAAPPPPQPAPAAPELTLAGLTNAFQPRPMMFVDPHVAATQTAAPAPVNYVHFPSGSSEGFFDVSDRYPTDKKPADAAAATGGEASAKAETVTKIVFKPTAIEGGQAGAAIDLTYKMLPQHIPCSLDVAMDSTLPGSISCHTRVDVLSPMHVLLMPAGTLIQGEYKSAVQTGQQRLFAFTGTAYTPEGIPVPLNSEIGDSLGRNGIPGQVDNHYVERFGAALALTGLESATQILQAGMSKSGGNQYLNIGGGGGGGGGISSVANQILQHQIEIPPTIYVQPGAVITVITDHIISFDKAIKVTTRERR